MVNTLPPDKADMAANKYSTLGIKGTCQPLLLQPDL